MIHVFDAIFRRTVAILLLLQCFKIGYVDGHYEKPNYTQAMPHSSPWMAQLHVGGTLSCSCFLISRNQNDDGHGDENSSDIVLTAAHCLYSLPPELSIFSPSSVKVIFGKHKSEAEGPADFSVDVVKVYIHPSFKPHSLCQTSSNGTNIAMLQLKHSVAYDNYTKPIRLPTMHQDCYKECHMNTWGKEEYAIFREEALVALNYKDVVFDHSKQLFGAYIPFYIDGSFGAHGSSLVCQQENQPIAVGLYYASLHPKSHKQGGYVSSFISTHRFLDWIKENINKTEKAPAYRSNLIGPVQSLSNSKDEWMSTKDRLEAYYYSKGISFNLNTHFENVTAIDYSLMDKMHKYLEIRNEFCIGDIKHSLVVQNADECALWCYKENHNGYCNYFSINNYCIPVEFQKSLSVLVNNVSLCMHFRDVEGHPPRKQYTQLIESRSTLWFQQYDVMLHGNKNRSFYCSAQLQSSGGEFYTTVTVSSSCMRIFWEQNSTINFFGLIAIVDGHSIYIRVNIDKFKGLTGSSPNATADLDNPIRRSVNMDHPSLGGRSRWFFWRYWPFNGAFRTAMPSAMPWIVRFFESMPDGADQYICTGVLISQTELLLDVYSDETTLVLASTSCLAKYQMNVHGNFYGLIGLYTYEEFPAVKVDSFRTLSGNEWPDQGFVLVQLTEAIKFNRQFQPIKWPSQNLSTYLTCFIASPPPVIEPIWPFQGFVMTEIPISIDSDDQGNLNITKLFKRSGNLDDVSNGDPIIACRTDFDTDCHIIGFFWSSGAKESYQQRGVSIYPHVDKINAILNEALI